MFKFLVSRVAKLVGRKVNTSFYMTLYREIFKEVFDLTSNPDEAAAVMKQLGIEGTLESSRRQENVLKLFPNDPKRVMEYLPIIWQVLFGQKMDDYTFREMEVDYSDYPALVYTIKKCPVCAGYGTDPEDTIDARKFGEKSSKYAAGLVGMLQEVANFILETRGNDYRIMIVETKCYCKGDDCMELFCHVVKKEEFSEYGEGEEEEFIGAKTPTVTIDFDRLERILSQPLDALKQEIKKLLKERLQMDAEEVLDHFRSYEEDMIRILGFLAIHFMNEPGRLIEKAVKNEVVSKIVGHMYNIMADTVNLYIPPEILEDYNNFLVSLLTDIAPDEMVERFKRMTPPKMVTLFLEGVKKALSDLGVDFGGLKRNIWEELEMHRLMEGLPPKPPEDADEDTRKRLTEIKVKILQEVAYIINTLISLPARIIISNLHSTLVAFINALGDVFANLKEHTEILLDLVEQLK